MKLIVGLGNPGNEYHKTRHNAGFMAIDELVKHYGFDKNYQDFQSDIFISRVNNEKIIFVKPLTYMNLSGQSVLQLVEYYKIPLEDILIIHDEKDFPVFKIQLKQGGSAGGHNGLKSVIQYLQSNDFKRLRIGIDKPRNPQNLTNYVLKPLSNQDQIIFQANLNKIKPFLKDWTAKKSFDFIMSRYNSLFNQKP